MHVAILTTIGDQTHYRVLKMWMARSKDWQIDFVDSAEKALDDKFDAVLAFGTGETWVEKLLEMPEKLPRILYVFTVVPPDLPNTMHITEWIHMNTIGDRLEQLLQANPTP